MWLKSQNRDFNLALKDFVRMSHYCLPVQQQFHEIVNRIRMVYGFIRFLFVEEEENEVDVLRERSDLRAYTVIRSHYLWMNRNKRTCCCDSLCLYSGMYFFIE
jgi:hypothetical protein